MSQKDSNKEEYISLTEATKYCDYSQEYLSLRARQGKLKAEKLGRNWVTTKEWVEEYFGKTNSSQARVQEKKANGSSFSINTYFPSAEERIEESKKIIGKLKTIFNKPELRYAVAGVLVFIFLGAGFMRACPAFSLAMVNEYTQWLNQTFVQQPMYTAKEFVQQPIYTAKENVTIGAASISNSSKSFYNKYVAANNWVEDKIQKIAKIPSRLSSMFFNFVFSDTEIKTKLADKEIKQELKIDKTDKDFIELSQDELSENTENGTKDALIVVKSPESEEDRKNLKEKIESSFSDEVEIHPEDENSGIIIPVFREKKGDEYLYLIVPIKED